MPVVTTAEYVGIDQIYAMNPCGRWPDPDIMIRPDVARPGRAASSRISVVVVPNPTGDSHAGEGLSHQAQGRHAGQGRGRRAGVRPAGAWSRERHLVVPGL